MKIHHGPGDYKHIHNPVVTVGTFDGVHRGHLCVINRLKEIASETKGESVVITFNLHPRQVLHGNNSYKALCTQREKEDLLRKTGIDHLVILPFTPEFAALSFGDFVSSFLVNQMHAKALVIGYDHHFGNKREGNFENLKPLAAEFGVDLFKVLPEEVGNTAVSSTKIRNALQSGNVKEANLWLGYKYSVTGKVVAGNMLGRKIGYPTANIQPEDGSKLIPAHGIYACTAIHDGNNHIGLLNIGIRPTIVDNKETIEVNILEFDKIIYGHDLTVVFHEFIRKEKKFDSLDALKAGIDADKEAILKYFKETRH